MTCIARLLALLEEHFFEDPLRKTDQTDLEETFFEAVFKKLFSTIASNFNRALFLTARGALASQRMNTPEFIHIPDDTTP